MSLEFGNAAAEPCRPIRRNLRLRPRNVQWATAAAPYTTTGARSSASMPAGVGSPACWNSKAGAVPSCLLAVIRSCSSWTKPWRLPLATGPARNAGEGGSTPSRRLGTASNGRPEKSLLSRMKWIGNSTAAEFTGEQRSHISGILGVVAGRLLRSNRGLQLSGIGRRAGSLVAGGLRRGASSAHRSGCYSSDAGIDCPMHSPRIPARNPRVGAHDLKTPGVLAHVRSLYRPIHPSSRLA